MRPGSFETLGQHDKTVESVARLTAGDRTVGLFHPVLQRIGESCDIDRGTGIEDDDIARL